jgi:hypothetical protein
MFSAIASFLKKYYTNKPTSKPDAVLSRSDKISLVLQKTKPTVTRCHDGVSVDRAQSYYYNLVSRYRISVMFSKSDPVNGTKFGERDIMRPSSESHRIESELWTMNIRRDIMNELGLDLEKLFADPNID